MRHTSIAIGITGGGKKLLTTVELEQIFKVRIADTHTTQTRARSVLDRGTMLRDVDPPNGM